MNRALLFFFYRGTHWQPENQLIGRGCLRSENDSVLILPDGEWPWPAWGWTPVHTGQTCWPAVPWLRTPPYHGRTRTTEGQSRGQWPAGGHSVRLSLCLRIKGGIKVLIDVRVQSVWYNWIVQTKNRINLKWTKPNAEMRFDKYENSTKVCRRLSLCLRFQEEKIHIHVVQSTVSFFKWVVQTQNRIRLKINKTKSRHEIWQTWTFHTNWNFLQLWVPPDSCPQNLLEVKVQEVYRRGACPER